MTSSLCWAIFVLSVANSDGSDGTVGYKEET